MTPFEEQLKRAMARQNPGLGFNARVIAAVQDESILNATGGWRRCLRWAHSWRLAPVLAALLLMSGGVIYQEHERVERGEAAKEKLLIAMHIAGSKLQQARHRVLEIEAVEVLQ